MRVLWLWYAGMHSNCEYTELGVEDSRHVMALQLGLGEGLRILPCINDELVTKLTEFCREVKNGKWITDFHL
jgi:hypothetical protein